MILNVIGYKKTSYYLPLRPTRIKGSKLFRMKSMLNYCCVKRTTTPRCSTPFQTRSRTWALVIRRRPKINFVKLVYSLNKSNNTEFFGLVPKNCSVWLILGDGKHVPCLAIKYAIEDFTAMDVYEINRLSVTIYGSRIWFFGGSTSLLSDRVRFVIGT